MDIITKINQLDVEIIKIFLANVFEKLSILQLAKRTRKTYANIYSTVKELERKDVIKIEKVGKSKICSLNFDSFIVIPYLSFVEELTSMKKIFKKFPYFKRIINEAKKIDPIICLGIFGSYASNLATRKSDIDTFILTDNINKFKKFIPKNFPELEEKIDLNIISFEEFIASLKLNKLTVSTEILKSKLILTNASLFYSIVREVIKENERRIGFR